MAIPKDCPSVVFFITTVRIGEGDLTLMLALVPARTSAEIILSCVFLTKLTPLMWVTKLERGRGGASKQGGGDEDEKPEGGRVGCNTAMSKQYSDLNDSTDFGNTHAYVVFAWH